MTIAKKNMTLLNNKGKVVKHLVVPRDGINRFYSLGDWNKRDHLVIVRLTDSVALGKVKYNHFVFKFETKAKVGEKIIWFKDPETEEAKTIMNHFEESGSKKRGRSAIAHKVMLTMLGSYFPTVPVCTHDASLFASVRGGGGVECHHNGINSGCLYFLRCGLLFVNKPVISIDVEEIEEIRTGRSGQRTFDLTAVLKDGQTHEFGMISSENLERLREYMVWVEKRRKFLGKKKAAQDAAAATTTATTTNSTTTTTTATVVTASTAKAEEKIVTATAMDDDEDDDASSDSDFAPPDSGSDSEPDDEYEEIEGDSEGNSDDDDDDDDDDDGEGGDSSASDEKEE